MQVTGDTPVGDVMNWLRERELSIEVTTLRDGSCHVCLNRRDYGVERGWRPLWCSRGADLAAGIDAAITRYRDIHGEG